MALDDSVLAGLFGMGTPSACGYITEYHAGVVRELWDRTEEEGVEYGTTLYYEDGEHKHTDLVRGSESSITGHHSSQVPSGSPVRLTLHTHPGGSIAFSLADLESVAGSIQFPPEAVDWGADDPVLRGTAIVGSRLGEEDIAIHSMWANDKALSLTIEEQNEVSKQVHSVNTPDVPKFEAIDEVQEILNDYTHECRTTLER